MDPVAGNGSISIPQIWSAPSTVRTSRWGSTAHSASDLPNEGLGCKTIRPAIEGVIGVQKPNCGSGQNFVAKEVQYFRDCRYIVNGAPAVMP